MKRRFLALLPLLLLGAKAPLPPLPAFIPSQLGPVAVLHTPNLICAGVEALGCFNGSDRRLEIRAGIPLVVEWQTLEHERVHMILWDSGQYIGGEREDSIADAIASNRIQEMLDK